MGSSITRILIDYFLFLYSIHYIHRQEGREQQFSAAACHYTCPYSIDHFFYSRLNRCLVIIDKTFVVENHGKFPSFLSAKYGGIAGTLKCNQVNKGAPWFYEIISKIECIEIIIMMKSDSRQQPCKHNRSDYCISQHCISVIQAAVDRIVISSVQSGCR